MINEPEMVVKEGFQSAWLAVVRLLMGSQWDLRNLVVQIRNPGLFDQEFHERMETFAHAEGMLGPKHVAYTIFPHRLYEHTGGAPALFSAYNRPHGFYDRVKTGWGTYFRRMTSYKTADGRVNQLDNIISAMRGRQNVGRAAYTVVISRPGGETVRPVGGPCLNYLAIQGERGRGNQSLELGLLAVYRNHDFLERAYGNYWGLCNLLVFLAREVGGKVGPLTCVSSHAYVSEKKSSLRRHIAEF